MPMTSNEEVQTYLREETNAVQTTAQFSHTLLSTTAFVQYILTCLLVIDDIFAEKVIVAQNYRGAQH